jgi:alginate O-acetyltransferase complex protein AlgI
MLFTDPLFLAVFLPFVWGGFRVLQHAQLHKWLIPWLLVSSLVFYSWTSLYYLPLLLGSIGMNAVVARYIGAAEGRVRLALLATGIGLNLLALGLFKYAAFTVETINTMAGSSLWVPHIALPLAISFYTFVQIAYLMDIHRRLVKPETSMKYALFVMFFPQLIAGPIVHHRELAPQLSRLAEWRIKPQDISVGLTLLIIGLFKKAGIADELAPTANAVFNIAQSGAPLDAASAWLGALAYTAQLYFDFSGYCDMALGIARLFAIRLPVNFNSPYQATTIIDFWRRWHITLSRFLRDYLYFPLGGGRKGIVRQGLNLLVVMLLGGLWHGAGWTFIAWGAVHGVALGIAHVWHRKGAWTFPPLAGWAMTMLFVVLAWVFFRADSLASAAHMFKAMAGLGEAFPQAGIVSVEAVLYCAGAMALAVWMPNALWLLRRYSPVFEPMRLDMPPPVFARLRWRPTAGWAFVIAVLFLAVIFLADRPKEFLYFQF